MMDLLVHAPAALLWLTCYLRWAREDTETGVWPCSPEHRRLIWLLLCDAAVFRVPGAARRLPVVSQLQGEALCLFELALFSCYVALAVRAPRGGDALGLALATLAAVAFWLGEKRGGNWADAVAPHGSSWIVQTVLLLLEAHLFRCESSSSSSSSSSSWSPSTEQDDAADAVKRD